ncbi:MAG: alpha/beta hydrolase [Thermoanaerobaculia bacterium]
MSGSLPRQRSMGVRWRLCAGPAVASGWSRPCSSFRPSRRRQRLYLRRDLTDEFLAAADRIVTVRVEAVSTTDRSRVDRLELLDAAGALAGMVLVRRPVSKTAPGPRRTLVVYAGKHTGERILALVPERPGLVLVAPLYPDIDAHGLLDSLAWPRRLRSAVMSTVGAGMATLADLDARGVARGRTVALGASLGSSFATIHAALDERVDELLIVHGGGDLPLVVETVYTQRGRPALAVAARGAAGMLVASFDPVRWVGRVSPRPLLVIASRRDPYFPVASVEELLAAARAPKRIVWTDTAHVGASKSEIVASIMAEIEAYLDEERHGLPLN